MKYIKKFFILPLVVTSCIGNKNDYSSILPDQPDEPVKITPRRNLDLPISLNENNEMEITNVLVPNMSDSGEPIQTNDEWEKDASFFDGQWQKLAVKTTPKVLSVRLDIISKKNYKLNFFDISTYSNLGRAGYEESDIIILPNKENSLLLAPIFGFGAQGDIQNNYFVPNQLYFTLQPDGESNNQTDQNDKVAIIRVDFEGIWTVYTYRGSVIYVNHQDATQNPFDLNRSHVDIVEFLGLTRRLACPMFIQFIKYFFDFMAYQNGMKVCYSVPNYFDVTFNSLGDYYISTDIWFWQVDALTQKLNSMKQVILNTEEEGKNLYCTKLYVDYPLPSKGLKASKHVVLLVCYNNQFFIIDTNETSELTKFRRFMGAMGNLDIRLSQNKTFLQAGDACDTCASIMTVMLSNYWKEHDHTLPLTEDNDIDYEKILENADRQKQPVYSNFFAICKSEEKNSPQTMCTNTRVNSPKEKQDAPIEE